MCTLLTVIAVGVSACGSSSSPPDAPEAGPEAQAGVPAAVEGDVHESLHALARACRRAPAARTSLQRPTRSMIRYYRKYPSERYRLQIDDESGTMLSALLVVREELLRCDRALARKLDAVLPRELQRQP